MLFLLSADFWGLSLFYYYRSHTRLAGVLWGALLFLTLLLSIPLFRRGLSNGVDLTFHLMRIEGLYEGLLSGQFPVKIQPGWLNGYGYPVSVFYGDFMLYFPALLRLCGYSIEESFKIFLFFLNLATILVTYHCLCRLSQNRLAAFTCTVLYCANLYRMMTMYGAPQIGCASAILFYPLVITGLYLLFSDTKQDSHFSHAWIYLVIGYTGILQPHIISCFLFALITILWAAFSVKKLFTRQVMLQLGKTILCVLPLNLGFLVPFVHYYTQKSKLNITAPLDLSQIDYASYYAKYQREGWSLESLLSGNEIGYCLAFCILLCLLFPYLRRHLPYQERLLFLLCITALALSFCAWFSRAQCVAGNVCCSVPQFYAPFRFSRVQPHSILWKIQSATLILQISRKARLATENISLCRQTQQICLSLWVIPKTAFPSKTGTVRIFLPA